VVNNVESLEFIGGANQFKSFLKRIHLPITWCWRHTGMRRSSKMHIHNRRICW